MTTKGFKAPGALAMQICSLSLDKAHNSGKNFIYIFDCIKYLSKACGPIYFVTPLYRSDSKLGMSLLHFENHLNPSPQQKSTLLNVTLVESCYLC